MNWLFKEEPSHYSYDAFAKDGTTVWSGVKNPVAQRNLRSVKKGDLVFYYHTGDEKSVVGIARALSGAYPDPDDASGKYVAVDIAPVKRLPRQANEAGLQPPAVIVIGEVVRFRDRIRWFDRDPEAQSPTILPPIR